MSGPWKLTRIQNNMRSMDFCDKLAGALDVTSLTTPKLPAVVLLLHGFQQIRMYTAISGNIEDATGSSFHATINQLHRAVVLSTLHTLR